MIWDTVAASAIGEGLILAFACYGFIGLSLGLRSIIRNRMGGPQSEDTGRDGMEAESLAKAEAITEALESLSDAVAVFDQNERIVYCNKRYTELTPETAALHVPGTTMEQLLRARLGMGLYLEARGREEEWMVEILHEFRSGTMAREQPLSGDRWVSVRYRRTDDGRIVGVRTDITKRKLAERKLRENESRLRDIAQISSDWLWEMDAEFRFRSCIGPGYENVGYSFPETEGMTRREVAAFRNWQVEPEIMRRQFDDVENHKPFYDFEYRMETASGEKLTISSSGIPFFDDDGEFMGYRGSSRDVTLLKSTEEELRNLQKMKAMGKLTGGIAHEFNNILAVVMGNLELLKSKISDEPALAKMIKSALMASRRGERLTSQLQSFSHTHPLRPQETDLGELVADMHNLITGTVGGSIRVTHMIPDSLDNVTLDPSQMQEALLALAGNAAEAMPDGGELTITAWNADVDTLPNLPDSGVAPEFCVALSFHDTGSGMTSEIMNSAVDPFFTTKGMATNSGLRLSMVHGFVAQSGGAISFASEPGEGTIVTLYFPASRKERIAAEPKGGKLILVVEDDLPVRITVVNMLTELGYRTIEAANGAEALALIDENPDIDLVFTDMVLPAGLSGAEIASEARKRLPDIRILFTSGYSENYLDTSGSNQEADQILRKPYRKRDMANIVKSALD